MERLFREELRQSVDSVGCERREEVGESGWEIEEVGVSVCERIMKNDVQLSVGGSIPMAISM